MIFLATYDYTPIPAALVIDIAGQPAIANNGKVPLFYPSA
jgi:hypothetical protein